MDNACISLLSISMYVWQLHWLSSDQTIIITLKISSVFILQLVIRKLSIKTNKKSVIWALHEPIRWLITECHFLLFSALNICWGRWGNLFLSCLWWIENESLVKAARGRGNWVPETKTETARNENNGVNYDMTGRGANRESISYGIRRVGWDRCRNNIPEEEGIYTRRHKSPDSYMGSPL